MSQFSEAHAQPQANESKQSPLLLLPTTEGEEMNSMESYILSLWTEQKGGASGRGLYRERSKELCIEERHRGDDAREALGDDVGEDTGETRVKSSSKR
ncbi:hypothetical protein LguiA_029712 [Lonicera macranthoides]